MGNSIPACQTDCRANDVACDAQLKQCIQELPMGKPEEPSADQLLLAACRDGDASSVEALLVGGADINARQPLKLVTLDRYQSGQPVRNCGMTPLMLAARNGHARCIAVLLKNGPRVNDIDEEGVTALHLACASGDLDCVKLLLDAGARANALNEDGESVLDYLPAEVNENKELLNQFKALLPEDVVDDADGGVCSESKVKTKANAWRKGK
eukprot:gb/GFBE01076857.1/.p1 GENE.gb/GFBE01076857.1/~~gb/GFBE01076857.1/.p1  ORF type:complete len:211 (+),score=61.01 gb/GFBE01076857.1/:1-633(+)